MSASPAASPAVISAGRHRRRVLLALGACLTLAACGKKGELELPPPESSVGPDGSIGAEQAGSDAE